MKIRREDVLYVAELAHLELNEQEIEAYRSQLDEILTYMEKLNALDTGAVEPMAQVLHGAATSDAVLREDHIEPCPIAGEALAIAPDPAPPYFRVPKVIEK